MVYVGRRNIFFNSLRCPCFCKQVPDCCYNYSWLSPWIDLKTKVTAYTCEGFFLIKSFKVGGPPLSQIFCCGKILLYSRLHLLIESYIRRWKREAFTFGELTFTLTGKFTSSLTLEPYFFQKSDMYRKPAETCSLMDWLTAEFVDFLLTDSHCWTRWATAYKPLY